MQHGATPLDPALHGVDYLLEGELKSRMDAASAVVCHGGPGTIALARRCGHVPIVVPRSGARRACRRSPDALHRRPRPVGRDRDRDLRRRARSAALHPSTSTRVRGRLSERGGGGGVRGAGGSPAGRPPPTAHMAATPDGQAVGVTESPTLGTRSTATTDAVRDAHSRLATVAEMLWPAADFERWIDRRSDERTGYLVLPSARRPRLLVPDDRRLIGTGIARSSVGSSLARMSPPTPRPAGCIAGCRSTASGSVRDRVGRRPRSIPVRDDWARPRRALHPVRLRPTEPEAGDPDG